MLHSRAKTVVYTFKEFTTGFISVESRGGLMIQNEGTAANPLATARRRRAVARGDRCIIILVCQSSYHRDKPGGDASNCNLLSLKVRPQGANSLSNKLIKGME